VRARRRDQAYPVVSPPSSAEVLTARLVRLARLGRRRLAYLDNTFPWARSGFRYHEAQAILELAPDTMFFSTWEMTDTFPAPVHPLAELPRLAPRSGITDAYGVFQLFLEGVAGTLHRFSPDDLTHPFAGPDLSRSLHRLQIRLHGSIYPGGGFVPTPEGYRRLRALSDEMTTMLSYVPEVLENVPGAVAIDQAFTEVGFYEPSTQRWEAPRPLVCLFAADSPPRKGLDVALAAFRDLDPDRYRLHVVGPHTHRRSDFPGRNATFHGWLTPAELRALHRTVHVFLSPVSAEPPGPGYQGVTDGFPTQTAADAMSSGCLLLSSNPAADHRVLDPGVHYLELPPVAERWRAMLLELAADPQRAQRIADAGSARVRERMDIRTGTARKLAAIGLLRDDGPRAAATQR
jgi:hypothetical protein